MHPTLQFLTDLRVSYIRYQLETLMVAAKSRTDSLFRRARQWRFIIYVLRKRCLSPLCRSVDLGLLGGNVAFEKIEIAALGRLRDPLGRQSHVPALVSGRTAAPLGPPFCEFGFRN